MSDILTQSSKDGKTKESEAEKKARKAAFGRAYYLINKEEIKKQHREYAQKNKEKVNEYHKRWYRENLEISKQRSKESKLRHPATPEQNRKATLKKRYGIAPEDYDRMYMEQGGCCAICGEWRERLHIDHSHKTKQVRQLLCENCNRALGMVKEDASLLEKAIEYLKRWSK